MQSDVARRLEGLDTADFSATSALGQEIQHRASAGDLDWAATLGVEVVRLAAGEGEGRSAYLYLLDRVQTVLASVPGRRSLCALMRVPVSLSPGGSSQVTAERRLAQMVASGHRAEDIVRVVYGREPGTAATHEFKACLLHEMVFEAVPITEYPALQSFGERLADEEHPLAVLPLHLLPTERGLRRPPHAPRDWTWALPPSTVAQHSDQATLKVSSEMRRRNAEVDPAEITVAEVAEVMGAAVHHWREQSNGMVAAQEFWSAVPVSPDDFAAVFERLPLTAWPEAAVTARLHSASADRVLTVLLTAAVRSPAYGPGLNRAYGRLAAWRSLGGLVGAPADAVIDHIAAMVEQTRWFIADPSSDWFHQVVWDLAVAALRPDRHEIAVLTATDTD
ncbi:DUF6183 family protein [Streptomyces sp. NBC_00306]|uniref:DUF6183 family protein n=1 Tax=Streptomyces sp. NBC_00306 TaxID=2975708 RepID=UPI002E28E57D|nr:DUF6183 family protein [Streptomyces sp. NBC_00306]